MLIGEVSKRSGVSARMLRHYDSLGLVRPSGRTTGGYRTYGEADIERIFHVESLRSLGLSLAEVQRALQDSSFSPAALVADLIDQAQQRLADEQELLSRLRRIEASEPGDWREVLHVVSLLRALGAAEAPVRQRTALSTAHHTPLPATALAEAVLAETEPNVAGAMRWALARAGSAGLTGISEGLRAADAQVRRRAIEACADIDGEPATGLLRSALTDDDDVVRARAALALAARGHPDAAPTLIAMVLDGHLDVEAAEALAVLARTSQAAAHLTATLLDRADGAEPDMRRRVVQALAELPGPAAREAVLTFRGDRDPSVARTAAAITATRGEDHGPPTQV